MLGSYSFAGGTTSTINYTIPLASLGLAVDDIFYFDAYSSGGGGNDSAIDTLANPNVSITGWAGPSTSNTGTGLNSYTVVPEASHTMLMLVGLAAIGWRRRR
ncbi:MAG: PEP-CTERM sorting domain-containing protein [Verrucomicrobiales bacterium]